jgi:branched-chain amino acid transport system ATP-binding protein
MVLLELNKINVYYSDVHVLRGISLKVEEGEIVSILGGNGAGKSTTINSISGLLEIASGEIKLDNRRIDILQFYEIARLGVIQIPEGRRLFPYMTIRENLEIGAYSPRAKEFQKESIKEVYKLFPVLAERKNQLARTLSGGEQQMVAIGRGLMARPKLLMLDEPSLGLAPIVSKEIFGAISQINKMGTTILLVEQDVEISLSLSNRSYVLENGQIAMEGRGEELLRNPHIMKVYLGI